MKAEKHTRKVSVFSWGAVEPALIKSLLVAVYTDRGLTSTGRDVP